MSARSWKQIQLAAAATFSLAGIAAIAPAQAVDFTQCVDLALKQNPQILGARAQVAEARGGIREARGHLLPKLSASFTASESNNALTVFGMKLSQRQATFNDFGAGQFTGPSALGVAPNNLNHPGSYNNYGTRFKLDVPIWNGGAIWGRLDQAQAMLKAAQSGDEMAKQQLIFALLQAYEGVRAADAAIMVGEKAKTAAESAVKTTQSLLQRGVVVKSDLLSAQVHLEETELALQHAQDAKANALEGLAILIGWPADKPLTVDAPVQPAAPGADLPVLQAQALANNAGIQALQHQVKAAQAGITVARAAYLPHVNAMAIQEWNGSTLGNAVPSYTLAGVVSWDVLDFARGGGMDQADAKRQQSLATLQEAQDHLRLQVAQDWRSAREAARRVQVRKLAVQQMEEAQRLIRLRYENGVETITGLLRGQAELDQVRADLVEAHYQEAVARGALLLALGKLNTQHIVAAGQSPVVKGVAE
ncbi:TolC family protein [Acidithiobacillus sulfuriphilus]|uniref:TolC family protein n=1 Tax=Acidithiobacillus sulfuriphilus TaxID=1867749 RepID=UPI003F613746